MKHTKRGEEGAHHGMDQSASGRAKDTNVAMPHGRTQIAMITRLGVGVIISF